MYKHTLSCCLYIYSILQLVAKDVGVAKMKKLH